MAKPGRPAILSQGTLLPLSVVCSVLIGCVILAWRLSAIYTTMDVRLGRIEAALADRAAVSVNEHDLRLWLMLLKDRNRDIKLEVPEWVK